MCNVKLFLKKTFSYAHALEKRFHHMDIILTIFCMILLLSFLAFQFSICDDLKMRNGYHFLSENKSKYCKKRVYE